MQKFHSNLLLFLHVMLFFYHLLAAHPMKSTDDYPAITRSLKKKICPRGNIRRSAWYFPHWLFGTTASLVGIINIYTGLKAYHDKTSRSTAIWAILFTAEICFLAFFHLLQDKWDYMQKQGLILGNNVEAAPSSSIQVVTHRENEKVLPPEPCGTRNALRNLFD